MVELKVKWPDGSKTSFFKKTFNQAIQAASREANRREMTYEIID